MMMGRADVKSAGELARILRNPGKETIIDKKTGKAKVLSPPMPTHVPGTMDGKASERRVPYDSREEEEWADILEARKANGAILEWWFQPERFRVGDGAWYTPDFRVLMPDQSIVFHEIKGGRIREAARVRFLAVASHHPYRYVMIQKRPKKEGGGWVILIDSHHKGGL
jgi:hypothetical protein